MKQTCLWLVLLLVPCAEAKDVPARAPAKVDQARVEEAIRKGVMYLRTWVPRLEPFPFGLGAETMRHDELILWTFLHAGVPKDDPDFKKLLENILNAKLERTYVVSLQAMVLEELDRVKYQWRIAQCAQFLVDNQCANGQWKYGAPSPYVDGIPSQDSKREVATNGPRRAKPKVVRMVKIVQRGQGPECGDNSNSQYAALGLRACRDAGIILPMEVLRRAQKWWRLSQHDDDARAKDPKAGRGWCYCLNADQFAVAGLKTDHASYSSMTAGAAGSLIIYAHLLGEDWTKDPCVASGIRWIAKNFTVTENHGPEEHFGTTTLYHYYYLYALERLGILYGTETFGTREWYPEGAEMLLAAQTPRGSWEAAKYGSGILDTCFAILFLRRATRPLVDVATGGAAH